METLVVYGDGIRDDTEAIQAYLDGKAELIHEDGTPFNGYRNSFDNNWGAPGKRYLTSKPLIVGR